MIGANFQLTSLSQKAQNIITSCTVKLVGPAVAKGGTFVGSGVIVAAEQKSGKLVIVSAAHNISIFNKPDAKKGVTKTPPPNFDTDLFKQRVKIQKDVKNPEASVTAVRLLKEANNETGLDLCVVEATSVEIAKAVTPLVGLQGFNQDWKKPEAVTLEQLQTLRTKAAKEGGKPLTFLNVGFGASSLTGGLTVDTKAQYRQVDFAKATYVAKSKEGFLELFILPASDKDTTAPGDSGGPLFMIQEDKVALLAVTLGANYYGDKIDDSATVSNSAFTKVLGKKLS